MPRKLKKALIILFMLIVAFVGYVEVVNLNSKNMSYRQKVLKAVYPLWMWFANLIGKNNTQISNEQKQPAVSFYTLKSTLNNGDPYDFSFLQGKKVLVVNTASDCGYTDQYDDLQKLYLENSDKLQVLAFPANDFKEQEKGTDQDIASFCKLNYGITFPLMKKSTVIKSSEQNDVFKWLTDSTKNGWNNKPPSWNFTKYLVNEKGVLTHYFGASVSPLSDEVVNAIKE